MSGKFHTPDIKRLAEQCVEEDGRRWGIFGVLLVAVVALGVVCMDDAVGLRNSDLGLAAVAHPTAARARLTRALGDILVKERLAVDLTESAELSLATVAPLGNDKTKVVDVWTIATDLAGLAASSAAHARLAARLTKDLPAVPSEPHAALRALRRPTPDTGAWTALVKGARVPDHVREWLQLEMPLAAVRAICRKNNGQCGATHAAAARAVIQARLEADAGTVATPLAANALQLLAFDPDATKAASRDFAARVFWAVTGVVFMTMAAVGILGGLYLLSTVAGRKWMAFIAGLAAVAFVLLWRQGGMGTPLLSVAVNRYAEIYGLGIKGYSSLFSGLAAAAVVTLLSSSWAAFLRMPDTADKLRTHLQTLRYSMNIATGLLVAGVLEVYAVSQLPAAFAVDEAAAKAINDAAATSAVGVAMVFSIVLFALYIPGALVLRDQADRLVHASPARKDEIKELLEETGFDKTGNASLLRFAQALLPILAAGPLTKVLELLATS